jgi:hypothetical protein
MSPRPRVTITQLRSTPPIGEGAVLVNAVVGMLLAR